jgi:hypothetical protein
VPADRSGNASARGGSAARRSPADLTIIDAGADTRIEFDATNSVTLVGLSDPSLLQASDFMFA